jgi:acetyl esterase/lipase
MTQTHPDDLMPHLDYAALVPGSLLDPPPVEVLPGTVSHLQVRYADVLGWRPLRLDLHVPASKAEQPFPAVVYVHGGSFLAGLPSMGPWTSLPRRGIAVACVSYRLSGEVAFPESVEDIRAAVRWLGAHAGQYGVDADKIALWGSSAGGYLAAMAAVSGSNSLGRPVGPDDSAVNVSAVVTHYAVTAPDSLRDDAFCNSEEEIAALEAIMRNFFDGSSAVPTSVADHLSDKVRVPPFLLMHGDADRRVGLGQSRRLQAALEAHGVQSELVVIPGADHGSPPFEAAETVDRVHDFLRRVWELNG